MNFNPQTAMEYAASIARPRCVGSGEDEVVADEIADQLRQFGWHVQRQPFRFSTAPATVLALEVFASLALVVVIFGFWNVPAVTMGAVALVVVLVVSAQPINRVVQSRSVWQPGDRTRKHALGKTYATANLVATLPGCPDDPSLPKLYLVAHYDSKSQRMPLAVRIVLFVTAMTSVLVFAVLTLMNAIAPMPIATVFGVIAIAAGLPLLTLDVGNTSPGAIDNASGVGLVLHLAECLAQRNDLCGSLCITVLIPSAEEHSLMGSHAYVAADNSILRRQSRSGGLYVLNFDGVGVDGGLYWVGTSSGALLDWVRSAGQELGIPLKRFRLIGALYDHMPFAQHGFEALSLIAVGKASRSVHTPQDSIDKLHVRGFDQAGRVTLEVIERLAAPPKAMGGKV